MLIASWEINMYRLIFILFLVLTNVNAYESEDKLKVIIVGKVAKFITWDNIAHDKFVITILKNPFDNLFDKIYRDRKIHKKDVQLKYINNINDLTFTNILYIPKVRSAELAKVVKETKSKNILTVSDMRGFAEKGGMIQIAFSSQQAKLKINMDNTDKENLHIKASLLKISDVIQGRE